MRGLSEPHAGMGRECGRNTNGVGEAGPPGHWWHVHPATSRSPAAACLQQEPVGRVEKSGCTAALGHLNHPPADVPNSFADAVGSRRNTTQNHNQSAK